MTAATVLPHVEAFMGVLNALPASCTAHLAQRPASTALSAAKSAVVVYPDAGAVEQTSLLLDEGFVTFFSLHGVGLGPEQALWALDEARRLLVGARPTVAGRGVWRIWQEQGPAPINRDDDVKPPLFTAYAEFGMRSEA